MFKFNTCITERGMIPALFVLLMALTGGSRAHAQTLDVIKLTAGMHVVTAEVAATDATRTRGLMYRKELPTNHGMLFVFEQPSVQCFWMRNTVLPLSIAYMLDDGTITNIADMAPMTENSHCSTAPVRYALEMEQGWFAKHGIQAGKKIMGLR